MVTNHKALDKVDRACDALDTERINAGDEIAGKIADLIRSATNACRYGTAYLPQLTATCEALVKLYQAREEATAAAFKAGLKAAFKKPD